MTDPLYEGDGSLQDQMMASLTTQGFNEGSLADRERERLIAKLMLSAAVAETFTTADLYELANESNRLAGLHG